MKKTDLKRNRKSQDRNNEQIIVASSGNALMFEKTKNVRKRKINSGMTLGTTITIFIALILTSFMSCNSPSEKVENAKENVTQAKEDLSKAHEDYVAEVELFKAESDKEITAFDKEIAEINKKIKNSNKKLKAEYERQIYMLEQKNNDMKRKMNDYKADKKEDWTSFKTEFNNDLNELGQALKNFTIDN